MDFKDIIKTNRSKLGLTLDDIARYVGVSGATVSRWESGDIENIRRDKIAKLAEILRVTPSYLMGWENDSGEQDLGLTALDVTGDDLLDTRISAQRGQAVSNGALHLAQAYDKLDAWGQKQVWSVTDNELARCAGQAQGTPAREADETVYYITSWFYHPMSAGTGEQAGDDQPESLRLIKEPPRGTSYVAPVHGDSMEPTYHSGDKLFICACEEIEPGQIGVFYMDGQQWVKELGDGVLISHNPAYPPRPMTEDIRCQGLVLGVCDDSYFK